jgi:glycosyltransferase involved in cell wall biosynthesis
LREPHVSVIIAVFNGERFLGEAIDSALAQSYPWVELIVVDDGSTDRSGEIAEQSGARVLRREHRGVSAARNAGLEVARGELITLLDADNLWPPERLALQTGYFRDRPDLYLLMGYGTMFFDPGEERPEWLTEEWLAAVRTVPLKGVGPGPGVSGAVRLPGTMMARAELFDRIGGYDTSYEIGEDIDWLMRATDAGFAHEVLPHVVSHHRLHAGNTSYRRREAEEARLRGLRSSLARKRAVAAQSPCVG